MKIDKSIGIWDDSNEFNDIVYQSYNDRWISVFNHINDEMTQHSVISYYNESIKNGDSRIINYYKEINVTLRRQKIEKIRNGRFKNNI